MAHGLVERQGRLLVLRRRDGRCLGGQWDVPGGTVEVGETPARAAVRECWEETGLCAVAGAEVSHHEKSDTEGRDLVFHTFTSRLHEVDHASEVHLRPDEHDDFRWLDPRDLGEVPLVWHVAETLSQLRWVALSSGTVHRGPGPCGGPGRQLVPRRTCRSIERRPTREQARRHVLLARRQGLSPGASRACW